MRQAGPVWSSSDESVATVNNGMVSAHAVGNTEITAAIGEVSAKCSVSVTLSDNFPVLELSQYDVLTITGNKVTVFAKVKFMGNTVENVNIEWRTADAEIATVENGAIIGVGEGDTVVTASVTYRGQLLEKQVTVKVAKDSGVMVSPSSAVIYSSNPAQDPNVKTEMQLLVSVFDGGAVVSDPAIEWISSDPEIASVNSSGLVRAVSNGTATITVTYLAENLSASCEITVTDAPEHYILQNSITFELVSEVSGNIPVKNERPLSIDLGTKNIVVPADAEYFIEDIGGNEIPVTGEAQNNVLSVDVAECNLAYGDGYVLKAVSGENWSVSLPLSVVTKVLKNAEDLQNIQKYAGFKEGDKTYDGYFVLEENIVLTETDTISNPYLPYCVRALGTGLIIDGASNTEGFTGIFDGRGYTISGGTFGDGGLLGYVSKDGVFKNTALVNVTLGGSVQGGGIVAGSFFGRTENILVDVKEFKQISGVTMRSIFGFNSGGALFENSIFYMPSGWTFDATVLDTALGCGIVGANNVFTNSYCFSAGVLGDGLDFPCDFSDNGWDNLGFFAVFSWQANVFTMNSAIARYAGLNRCPADADLMEAGIDSEKFDDSIWDMSGEKAAFVSQSK